MKLANLIRPVVLGAVPALLLACSGKVERSEGGPKLNSNQAVPPEGQHESEEIFDKKNGDSSKPANDPTGSPHDLPDDDDPSSKPDGGGSIGGSASTPDDGTSTGGSPTTVSPCRTLSDCCADFDNATGNQTCSIALVGNENECEASLNGVEFAAPGTCDFAVITPVEKCGELAECCETVDAELFGRRATACYTAGLGNQQSCQSLLNVPQVEDEGWCAEPDPEPGLCARLEDCCSDFDDASNLTSVCAVTTQGNEAACRQALDGLALAAPNSCDYVSSPPVGACLELYGCCEDFDQLGIAWEGRAACFIAGLQDQKRCQQLLDDSRSLVSGVCEVE